MLAAVGFAAAFGLPRWILSFLKKRRETKFIEGFADAVDVIVRGIKAGLPLLDSSRSLSRIRLSRFAVNSRRSSTPRRSACRSARPVSKLFERMPLAEANFFGIVVSIQQKAGGNLSEALGNLSRVLRDRKKMKAKIKAMSMEAKASAGIIGALPPLVMLIVYITSPDYISLLWEHRHRPDDAGRQRAVDDGRHSRDEENDQLRFLSSNRCSNSSSQNCTTRDLSPW